MAPFSSPSAALTPTPLLDRPKSSPAQPHNSAVATPSHTCNRIACSLNCHNYLSLGQYGRQGAEMKGRVSWGRSAGMLVPRAGQGRATSGACRRWRWRLAGRVATGHTCCLRTGGASVMLYPAEGLHSNMQIGTCEASIVAESQVRGSASGFRLMSPPSSHGPERITGLTATATSPARAPRAATRRSSRLAGPVTGPPALAGAWLAGCAATMCKAGMLPQQAGD